MATAKLRGAGRTPIPGEWPGSWFPSLIDGPLDDINHIFLMPTDHQPAHNLTPRVASSPAAQTVMLTHRPAPARASRTRPMSLPASLPRPNYVLFPNDPVTSTRVYNTESPVLSTSEQPKTPESSPFEPNAHMRPADGRPPPAQPVWSTPPTTLPRSSIIFASPVATRSRSTPPPSRIPRASFGGDDDSSAPTAVPPRRSSLHRRTQSLESPLTRTSSITRLAGAPSPTSPFVPIPAPSPSRRQSSYRERAMQSQRATGPTCTPTPTPRPRESLFKRAKTVTRSKIFGTPNSAAPKRQSGVPNSSQLDDLDLRGVYHLVKGRITFDSQIKVLFEENGGLGRIWNDEAVPLFHKGDKQGFIVVVKRLQTAMTALKGESVVFG